MRAVYAVCIGQIITQKCPCSRAGAGASDVAATDRSTQVPSSRQPGLGVGGVIDKRRVVLFTSWLFFRDELLSAAADTCNLSRILFTGTFRLLFIRDRFRPGGAGPIAGPAA